MNRGAGRKVLGLTTISCADGEMDWSPHHFCPWWAYAINPPTPTLPRSAQPNSQTPETTRPPKNTRSPAIFSPSGGIMTSRRLVVHLFAFAAEIGGSSSPEGPNSLPIPPHIRHCRSGGCGPGGGRNIATPGAGRHAASGGDRPKPRLQSLSGRLWV